MGGVHLITFGSDRVVGQDLRYSNIVHYKVQEVVNIRGGWT